MGTAKTEIEGEIKMETTMKKFKVLGTNGDRDTCDCCGRTDLQKVVWVENLETFEILALGVVCASKVTKEESKAIKAAAKEADTRRKAKERMAQHRLSDAACQFRDEWSKRTGKPASGNWAEWRKAWLESEDCKVAEDRFEKEMAELNGKMK